MRGLIRLRSWTYMLSDLKISQKITSKEEHRGMELKKHNHDLINVQ